MEVIVDIEVLKKRVSTFKGEGGRIRITDDQLYLEILQAWEQWKGTSKEFFRAIGVSKSGLAAIIGKAKRMRREGHFPAEEFKELKLSEANVVPLEGSGIEVNWSDGRFIKFYQVEQLIDFLKKVV